MPKRVHSGSDRDEESAHPNVSKRTRKSSDLTNLCQEFYDTLRSYKSEDGKLLSEHFLRLPSKRANADYYSTIKDPIDLTQIQEKVHQNQYQTFEEFLDDLELLFNNAKNFYRKNTNEWRDANELSKYFYSKIQSNKTEQKPVDPFYFEEFFTAIYNAQIDDRPITDIFLYLPSRKIYPDYYLIVTKPIDLKIIATKIQNQDYQTLEDMENDLLLMISNARKYNDPKSQIYKDACALKKIITSVRNELESALKSGNERLRLKQPEILLTAEVANSEYPAEPDDDEILPTTKEDAESETSSLADEDDSIRILYNTVKKSKLGAQTLIDPFLKLPNRRFHQDYYEEIKRPIAMSVIKNNIQKGKYNDLADLVDDFRLMFDNAMHYNQEGSLIYNSAKRLLDITLAKARELGYDETKPRSNSSTIKEESLDALIPSSPNSQRTRLTKKPLKTAEQNIQMIYHFIREYRENDVGLIAPFLELPSAEEYPDYYETIEQPIDMTMIKEKIDKGLYKREQELVDDLNRMFSNAKIYNVDESYIFKYASRLEQALAAKYKTVLQQKKERTRSATTRKFDERKSLNTLEEKVQHLIQSVKNFTDRHGRTLSTPFLTLPLKSEYPDYYEIIRRPIDLKRIETRSYPTIDDLIADFHQMFDNACTYNEPGSTIYRDALTLKKFVLEKSRELKIHEHDVLHIPNLVQELLIALFIRTINYEDDDGQYLTDSFADFTDPMDNEPFDLVYTYDLIRQNLEQRRYQRLDVFQEDFFKVFQRLRYLATEDSQTYDDSIKLQKYYIRLRNEMCLNGGLLRSTALQFTEERLDEEIRKEKSEKFVKKPNSTISTKSSEIEDEDDEEEFNRKAATSTERSVQSKGQTYVLGDFVYIDPVDASDEPTIICIEAFERRNNEDCFSGLQFLRPHETFHSPTRKFLRREVFLTETVEHVLISKIQGRCYVLPAKDYFKYRPICVDPTMKMKEFADEDVYVCESRYNLKTKSFKKLKSWNVPDTDRVDLVPRDTILDSTRLPSTLVHHLGTNEDLHRSSTSDSSDSSVIDRIEKVKETILYDSVINQKLNENSSVQRDYYEQIVLSPTKYYKVGDFVYVTNIEPNKRFILRLEKIWKNNDAFVVSGPVFLQPSDIPNREHLIITTKSSFPREVIKRDGPSTQVPIQSVKGKCSVLSMKHFCTYRITDIPESDVYLCESKYCNDDHSLRVLSKPLKRISLSAKAVPDEIWTFRKELLLKQENSFGSMDVDDQNSNQMMEIDEPLSHSMSSDLMNNLNHSNGSLLNRTQNNRKSQRRPVAARPPCGYLVFASETRKRLIRENPGIPFGEISRIIGDQWRRLNASEREKYEEKARERAREQEHPIIAAETPPRLVNGYAPVPATAAVPSAPVLNGILPVLLKQAPLPAPAPVPPRPPRVQRLVHSEVYFRYIEHLKRDHPFISDWPRQLKASICNPISQATPRQMPSQWFLNQSPGLYTNIYEALWSMRDHMWSDVIRVRNVLSDEW